MNDVIHKPRALTMISWTWIGWGTFMAYCGLRDFSRNIASAGAAAEMGLPLAEHDMFIWIQAMAALLAIVGIAGIAGAAGLLKLRAWGRSVLVAANWGTVGIIGVFAYQWQDMAVRAASTQRFYLDDPALLGLSWESAQPIFLGLLVFATIAVPFVWMARKLEGRAIMDALGRAFTARFDAATEAELT